MRITKPLREATEGAQGPKRKLAKSKLLVSGLGSHPKPCIYIYIGIDVDIDIDIITYIHLYVCVHI